jgi:hypothetical protein
LNDEAVEKVTGRMPMEEKGSYDSEEDCFLPGLEIAQLPSQRL